MDCHINIGWVGSAVRGNLIPLCCVLLTALTTGPASAQDHKGECVVLVHGLGRTALSMKRVQWALAAAGYQVVNFTYPSRKYTVEQLSEDYLQRVLAAKVPQSATKVHFVTHSMGGILLREYLTHHTITNLGRVVMMAPPNHGSRLAEALRRHAVGRFILGPAGRELGTGAPDLPQRLGPIDFSLGIIAGDVSWNPFFSGVLESPNDGKVSVASTKAAGMSDFVILHTGHTWMMWRRQVLRQIKAYLRDGRFEAATRGVQSQGAF